MKIVNIIGGLGNQMFQYALAVALRELYGSEEVRIDPSAFKGYRLHNGYELKRIFKVDIPEATVKEQWSVYYPLRNYRMWQIGRRLLPRRHSTVIERDDMAFEPNVLSDSASAYYLGYWQTEKYFTDVRPVVLEAFSFPDFTPGDRNDKLIGSINGKLAVSVHVRRGDYVNISNTQSICTLDYYRQSLELLMTRVNPDVFLIFSDDIEWCRQNLDESFGGVDTIYVDWNRGAESYRDMQLMSLCNHNIIANSSFSWWGAWLNGNPGKIVIAPSRWMNGGGWVDMIPDSWIKINSTL